MRRPWKGHIPVRPRGRKHRPREIPADRMARERYGRLLGDYRPPPHVFELLSVLMAAAGNTLADVLITQPQISQALQKGPNARTWGAGVPTVRRAVAEAVALGFLSVEDVKIDGRGIHINQYRFHVPEKATPIWRLILRNSKEAHKRSVAASKARQSAARAGRPAPPTSDPNGWMPGRGPKQHDDEQLAALLRTGMNPAKAIKEMQRQAGRTVSGRPLAPP